MVTDAIEKFNEAMEIGDGPSIHRTFGIMQSKADRMIALDEDITARITEGTTSMTNEEMNEELKDIEMAHSGVIDVRIQYDLYIQSTEQKDVTTPSCVQNSLGRQIRRPPLHQP
ncbi:hypothetical protein GE061_017284 [Apolygus lucorum]|uniref:Uncharacterized protein n=1 Tax=Apolygus lucorum TaxID=248454 RepID=A0A8S9XBX1_APOLU|nr:hypothetical protein GE061_017284 [Apolygus lucorum]